MKKKKLCRRLDGLLPLFQYESRYNELYRDTGQLGRAAGGHNTASNPEILPHDMASKGHHTAGLCAGASGERARGWPGHGESRDTNFVSWLGATVWCLDMEQQGCDTAQQRFATRRRSVATCAVAHKTRRAAGFGSRYNFCIVTEGSDNTAVCACDTVSARCDTAGHNHDTAPVFATTRLKCTP